MKKLFALSLATVLLLTAGNAAAQKKNDFAPQEKGWWIGGLIGYWYDDGEHEYVIAPEVGYDFNNRWAVGTSIGFIGLDDIFAFEVAPYARWKFYRTERLTLFLDGGFGAVLGEVEGFKAGFRPGMSVKLSNHFNFLTSFGFLGYCNEFYNNGMGDGFGLKFSSSDLKIGFYYTF